MTFMSGNHWPRARDSLHNYKKYIISSYIKHLKKNNNIFFVLFI